MLQKFSILYLFIPQPLAIIDPFAVAIVLAFPECPLVEIIAFLDCLLSLSNMHLKVLNVFSWLDSLLLLSAE